jgi:hypothetical protein
VPADPPVAVEPPEPVEPLEPAVPLVVEAPPAPTVFVVAAPPAPPFPAEPEELVLPEAPPVLPMGFVAALSSPPQCATASARNVIEDASHHRAFMLPSKKSIAAVSLIVTAADANGSRNRRRDLLTITQS